MIDLNNYSQVIYVDAINGDDTIGDGSSNNPYASVIKAVNSATLDNTLIYLKEGIYALGNGLSSTIRTDIELIFFGETVLDRDKKVIFDLQATYQNHPKMTKQHTYIGIVFKRSGIASSVSNDTRVYEYFNDSSTLNIQFKNCVFDVGDITPSDCIIFTGHSNGCTIVKLEYINCSIIPNNLSGKKDSKTRKGNFINCAIADSDLTTDTPNQLSSTFNYNYELTNPIGEYGVYFGEYAWKQYINKTLILSNGKTKTYISNTWENVTEPLDSTVFLNKGMDDLSVLNRQVTELPPMQMEDKTNILFTNGEVGKVFSKTIDLKKYFDIRNFRVEVK